MGGHEIGQRVLFFPVFSVAGLKLLPELLVHCMLRLSHKVQNTVGHMLRGHPELPADMIFDQFLQKFSLPVRQHIIEADAGTNENLSDLRNPFQLAEKPDIIGVIRPEIRAGFREQTGAVRAGAFVSCFSQAGKRKSAVGPPTS